MPAVLEPASPVARRSGVFDEGAKQELLRVLKPQAESLVDALEKVLKARVRSDNGRPSDHPGRHLFYAALLYLAQRVPDHESAATELRNALQISAGHMHNLCAEMKRLFQGSLSELCQCEGGGKSRYSFKMPTMIVR